MKLTEAQLNEQLKKAKEDKAKKVSEKINAILKAENCIIKPELEIAIQGKAVGVIIVAL